MSSYTQFAELDPSFAGIILVPIIGAILGLMNVVYLKVTRLDSVVVPTEGALEKKLVEIAGVIQEGASAFLMREYSFMLVFVIIMAGIVGGATENGEMVLGFIMGAILSAACGWIGMRVAVQANYRTTYVASQPNGLNNALKVAFASGAVMGFGVVCSGILGLVILYSIFQGLSQEETRYLAGFGFGASSIALFARVGGGIYTKAADVGADLVGKVESNMPEDDPRNPATIADNVGDNVGDVAGMGADLFESFVGSIIAAIQLSQGFWTANQNDTSAKDQDIRGLIAFPFYIASFGIVCSCIGIYFVRTG